MVMTPTINSAAYLTKFHIDRNTGTNQSAIGRISTGSRIIRASDDSAALTISNKLLTRTHSMEQGRSNIMQGIYMLQIGASGLTEIDKTLTRLKALTTQAVNDTLSNSEISYVQTEINALVEQIDLTAQQTRYKGTSVLVGTQGTVGYTHTDKTAANLAAVQGFLRTDGNNDGDFDDPEDNGALAFNADLSGGFVLKTFENPADVLIEIKDNEIQLDIDGEIFAAQNAVKIGEPIILTSKTHKESRIAFNVSNDAADFLAIDTDTELVAAFKSLLSEAELRIGINEGMSGTDLTTANTDANLVLTPAGGGVDVFMNPTNFLNRSLSHGIVQGDVETISVAGNQADYSVEITVGGELFRATSVTLQNSENLTLTSVVDPGNAFSLRLGEDIEKLAAYAGGGGGPNPPADSAAFLQQVLETALSTPAADVNDPRIPATFNIGVPEAMYGFPQIVEGFNVPGNVDPADQTLQPLNTLNTRGFIEGAPTAVTVTPNGRSMDVRLTVGEQVFLQGGFQAANGGQLTLVSESDPENVISFNLSNNAAAVLNTPEALRARLEILMGLDDGAQTAVRFQSGSGEYHDYNGLQMGYNTSLTTQPGTPPGTYALSYDVGTRTFKLTDGQTIERLEVPAGVNQILNFRNGVLLNIGSATHPFDPTLPMSQIVFEVGKGENHTVNFQLSAEPGDETAFTFEPATSTSLGLNLIKVATHEESREAQRAIGVAIETVNMQLATIGAVMVQFESLADTLNSQILNTRTSRQDFYDSDFALEMIEFSRSQALMEAGVSMLAQANSLPETLLRLVQ